MDNPTLDQPTSATQADATSAASDPPAPSGRVTQAGDTPSAPASGAAGRPKGEPAAANAPFTRLDDIRPGATAAAGGVPSPILYQPRARRFAPLAAAVAIAAAVGA